MHTWRQLPYVIGVGNMKHKRLVLAQAVLDGKTIGGLLQGEYIWRLSAPPPESPIRKLFAAAPFPKSKILCMRVRASAANKNIFFRIAGRWISLLAYQVFQSTFHDLSICSSAIFLTFPPLLTLRIQRPSHALPPTCLPFLPPFPHPPHY